NENLIFQLMILSLCFRVVKFYYLADIELDSKIMTPQALSNLLLLNHPTDFPYIITFRMMKKKWNDIEIHRGVLVFFQNSKIEYYEPSHSIEIQNVIKREIKSKFENKTPFGKTDVTGIPFCILLATEQHGKKIGFPIHDTIEYY